MEKGYIINVVGCGWKEEKGKAKKVVTPAPIAGDNKSANGGLSHTIHSQLRSWSGGITFRREYSIVGVRMFSHTETFLLKKPR